MLRLHCLSFEGNENHELNKFYMYSNYNKRKTYENDVYYYVVLSVTNY